MTIVRKWFAAFLSLFASVPSLADTQKANRLALADHLEKNVTDDKYNHIFFWDTEVSKGCAMGHAVQAGIGGLKYAPSSGNVPIIDGIEPGVLGLNTHYYGAEQALQAANVVFGEGSYLHIFDSRHDFNRRRVIEELRNFEPIAA